MRLVTLFFIAIAFIASAQPKVVKLAELEKLINTPSEKIQIINFWATWCGPCKEEMPSLARLQSQFDSEQVRVVTVTTDIYPQGIKQFLDNLGITLPVLFDEDQELSRRFMVRGLPTTILIGQNGQAVGRAVGPRAWDSRESIALVRQVLEQQP